MNRAQRRALARGKLPAADRFIPLPPALDEFTVFDMPQTILDKICHGQIEAHQGVPVFRDNTGELCEICPALAGWIYTWQRINDQLGSGLDLNPLKRLHNKLHADMPLTENDVQAATDTLDAMRKIYRTADRARIKSIAKTAQIALLMEDRTA